MSPSTGPNDGLGTIDDDGLDSLISDLLSDDLFKAGYLKPTLVETFLSNLERYVDSIVGLKEDEFGLNQEYIDSFFRDMQRMFVVLDEGSSEHYGEDMVKGWQDRVVDLLVAFMSNYMEVDISAVADVFVSRLTDVAGVANAEFEPEGDPLKQNIATKLPKLFFDQLVIAAKSKMLEAVTLSATIDPLTGVMNRRGAEVPMERLLRRAAFAEVGSGKGCAFVFLDIDHFKRFNDTYGHDLGDEVLKATAQILTESSRPGDVVARLGGEELLLVLNDVTRVEAVVIAERFRVALESKATEGIDGLTNDVSVSASIGVCHCGSKSNMSVADAIKASDTAMYEAKGNGRNCVYVCDADGGYSEAVKDSADLS